MNLIVTRLKYAICSCVLLLSTSSSGQIDTAYLQSIIYDYDESGRIYIHHSENIAPGYLAPLFLGWLSVESDSFTFSDSIVSEVSSIDNYLHIKYRQYHYGYPVEGAEIIEHIANGNVTSMNGKYAFPWPLMEEAEVLDPGMAIDIAINHDFISGIHTPLWLDSADEAELKIETGDSLATHFPVVSLIWALENTDSLGYEINGYDYTLCYNSHVG